MTRYVVWILVLAVCSAAVVADDRADLARGAQAYGDKDYAGAFRIFAPLAEKGWPEAQYMVAFMHWRGRGTGQDSKAAARWFAKAAERGVPEAICNLGILYRDGDGVGKDLRQARLLLEQAAFQSSDTAQAALGALCVTGAGGPTDLIDAAAWYLIASRQDKDLAAQGLAELRKRLGADMLKHADARAKTLAEQVRAAGKLTDLREAMEEILVATKRNDSAERDKRLADLALPDDKWFSQTFGPEFGAKLAAEYAPRRAAVVEELTPVFQRLIELGRLEVHVNMLLRPDDPKATGAQAAALRGMTSPVPLYSVRFVKPGIESGQHLWSFARVGDAWRLVGKLPAVGED